MLEEDIELLQTKLAFQEDTLEKLNMALADQQKQLDRLTFQLRHVTDRLRAMQPSDIATDSEETPPPHY
ncbi:SlyX family protein [Bowmanella dokdonensis]|uniref:Protein SlyX homolog n=1 Tax=Bowmanella dokdonensis TaxID=751969 RepID=A0A939DJT1_9ALTE|nr:SlyX family protein [Bowmanella dokdonensis]MBN7823632.1 SlyX family protein [Bowmanella dokdonensis]